MGSTAYMQISCRALKLRYFSLRSFVVSQLSNLFHNSFNYEPQPEKEATYVCSRLTRLAISNL